MKLEGLARLAMAKREVVREAEEKNSGAQAIFQLVDITPLVRKHTSGLTSCDNVNVPRRRIVYHANDVGVVGPNLSEARYVCPSAFKKRVEVTFGLRAYLTSPIFIAETSLYSVRELTRIQLLGPFRANTHSILFTTTTPIQRVPQ